MQVRIYQNHRQASSAVANLIIQRISESNISNLGLATGSTYLHIYYLLHRAYEENLVDFKNLNTFNLDEYVDINQSHPQSFRNFMYKHFFKYVNINDSHIHFPQVKEGVSYDSYDQLIQEKGGLDLLLLGIGENGHIAFNEPGTSFDIKTHKIKLTKSTREANKKFFNQNIELVPKYAVTMGIDTIMRAKEIIVSAFGKNKSKAIYDMMRGDLTEDCPASVLQNHSNVKVMLDESAAFEILKGEI